jgi:hypothetical protein
MYDDFRDEIRPARRRWAAGTRHHHFPGNFGAVHIRQTSSKRPSENFEVKKPSSARKKPWWAFSKTLVDLVKKTLAWFDDKLSERHALTAPMHTWR